jgi:hypothetical protein
MKHPARVGMAILSWVLAFVSGMIAATDYRIPIATSLLATVAYFYLVRPFWRTGVRGCLMAVPSVVLFVLAVDSCARVVAML